MYTVSSMMSNGHSASRKFCQIEQSDGHINLQKLNRYYDGTVTMSRQDTKKSVGIVIPLIRKILTYVNEQDPRFLKEEQCQGSYYQQLKVGQADEFDYAVFINTGQLVWASSTPRYYNWDTDIQKMVSTTVRLPSPPTGYTKIRHSTLDKNDSGSAPLTYNGDIIPILVKRRLKSLVTDAIRELGLRDQIRVSKIGDTPASKLTILKRRGFPHEICVDLCPMAPSQTAFRQDMNWPRTRKVWPSTEKIREIKAIGINDVTKTDLNWRLSFAFCEQALLQNIDNDGGCRKKSQRIMKKLKSDVWCPIHVKPELSSFHLKNILFWECEDHPYTHEWDQDNLAVRVESMTRRLLGHLRTKRLPMYFYPDVDLLASKDPRAVKDIVANIELFLRSPNQYV